MHEIVTPPIAGWVFGLFVVTVVSLAAVVIRAAAKSGAGIGGASALVVGWLGLSGALAVNGFFNHYDAMPPRFALGALPPLAAIVLITASPKGRARLRAVPPAWLIGFQAFRVFVELGLLGLAQAGAVPFAMTFEGRNFDILTGLTALPIAYFCFVRRSWPRSVALAWNIAGLALLINVIRIAVLTAPGPLRHWTGDTPNLAPSLFPFMWLPYFLVPLALFGHIGSLIQIAGGKTHHDAE